MRVSDLTPRMLTRVRWAVKNLLVTLWMPCFTLVEMDAHCAQETSY
jgi:hypothetical protein